MCRRSRLAPPQAADVWMSVAIRLPVRDRLRGQDEEWDGADRQHHCQPATNPELETIDIIHGAVLWISRIKVQACRAGRRRFCGTTAVLLGSRELKPEMTLYIL